MKDGTYVSAIIPVVALLILVGVPGPVAYGADTAPPTGSIVINNNRSATNTPNVTLSLTWNDGEGGSGVSRMRFSDDGAHWTAWEVLAATRAHTLPSGDGHKTVRVQYLDKANNRSVAYSDYIRLDTTPPTGGIVINDGAVITATQLVKLNLNWSDGSGAGVTRVRFSDNGSNWTVWGYSDATRAHMLPPGPGNHTVRVQYLDGAGNYSAVYNDYIKLVPSTEETVMLPGDVPLVMVWIPGGTFTMGSPDTEQDRNSNEGPQHRVTLDGYWMGKYELTKGQWQAVMNTTPWAGPWGDFVIQDPESAALLVSWEDAQRFMTAINAYTGKTFHLPSEAQWEYACRAGTSTRFYWGNDPGYVVINDYARWYGSTLGSQFAGVVGRMWPNAWGLFDMGGNVWEWCQDYFDAYGPDPQTNPTGPATGGGTCVVRGGFWLGDHFLCRSASRGIYPMWTADINIGLRLSR